jgi:Papain-like cysteine protease AvrRpt2
MFSRRGLFLFASLPILTNTSVAGLTCQDYPGFRRCSVGVRIQLTTAQQKLPHWCWAACIETIFAFHGHAVAQEEIVEKVFGDQSDQAAFGPQIVEAVDGSWVDQEGNSFDASASVLWDSQFGFGRPDAVVQAARELENDRPLIVGAFGHATVMTAMTYSMNAFTAQLEELVVRDPWPGNPNRRTLSLQEALGTQFLAQISVD